MMRTAPASAPVSADADVTIDEVLAGRLVQPLFQPIVDLSTRAVVGLEALARGPAGTRLEFPDQLFAAAREAGRLGELDMLCSERALECAVVAAVAPPLLFINAEPGVLDQPLSPRLLELVLAGLPFREVLEFVERALPAVPGSLLRIAGMVQQWGNGLALDDVGVDPMSLAFLPVIEPEVIKLDMSLLRHPEAESTQRICAVVRAEAQRTAAVVIAEGIETPDDLVTARALGAHWGQGWLFGRPAPIEQPGRSFDLVAASALRAPRPGFHQPEGTPFQIATGHGKVVAGTAEVVAAALTGLRDIVAADDTFVVATRPDISIPGVAGILHELTTQAHSVIMIDDPVPGEFAVVVLGPGFGAAVCVRSSTMLELVTLEHLPAIATVTRALLNRLV